MSNATYNDFYKKQMSVNFIGTDGQTTLRNSSILIIGAGGLGTVAATYLARAGIGKIHICDFDKISLSNLPRQITYLPNDIEKFKVDVIKTNLQPLSFSTKIETSKVNLTSNNFKDYISDIDLILDCTDNFNTKLSFHDLSFKHNKDIIIATIDSFSGQLYTFKYSNPDNKKHGCLRCLYPCDVKNINENIATVNVTPGIFGIMQAAEAIKLLLNQNTLQSNQSLLFNINTWEMEKNRWQKNSKCKLCSNQF